MPTRDELHARIDRLSDAELEQAAALLDSLPHEAGLPPALGSSQWGQHRALAAFGLTPASRHLVRDRALLEGQVAFEGTRIPVWVLFNYLTDERALASFHEAYPQLSIEALAEALDLACIALTGQNIEGEQALPARRPRRAS